MLNTQKFNRGKFNILSNGITSTNGTIIATSGMHGLPYIIYSATGSVRATGRLEGLHTALITQGAAEPIVAQSGVSGEGYRRVEIIGEPVLAVSSMTAKTDAIFGVEAVSMPDMILKPGQELIIDTEDMTVTIDGENAIHLLSDDSDFFFLAQGENLITYSDNGQMRTVSMKVMRKDRWL